MSRVNLHVRLYVLGGIEILNLLEGNLVSSRIVRPLIKSGICILTMTELKKSGPSDPPDNEDNAKSIEETQVREVGNDQLNRAFPQRHLVRDHAILTRICGQTNIYQLLGYDGHGWYHRTW